MKENYQPKSKIRIFGFKFWKILTKKCFAMSEDTCSNELRIGSVDFKPLHPLLYGCAHLAGDGAITLLMGTMSFLTRTNEIIPCGNST